MKRLKFSNLIVGLTLLSCLARAGGVSDGGGGTSVPVPVEPDSIVQIASREAAPAIITWLNREEDNFSRLSSSEKEKSPYNKIFQNQKSVYDVIRQTSIELHMKTPCYDAKGEPREGSIFADQAKAICLSPFTMAPKLNENNYSSETAALIFHEISHFMGTTEEEANRLQREAIWAFNKFEMLDLLVNIDLLADGTLGGGVSETMINMTFWLKFPHLIKRSDIELFSERLLTLRDYRLQMGSSFSGPALLRRMKFNLFTLQFVRTEVIEDFICSNDPTELPQIRKDCADKLQKAFQNDLVITARQFEERTTGSCFGGPEWDQVTVQRPNAASDLVYILTPIRDYLLDVKQELQLLKNFHFPRTMKN